MSQRCFNTRNLPQQVDTVSSVHNICSSTYLGCEAFVTFLGVVGALFTVTDIFRIIRCGPVLDEEMWGREQSKDGSVNPVLKRDLKLVSSVMGAEHYLLLLIGSISGKPLLLVPWLIVQAFVIVMEIFVFFLKLTSGGVHVFKGEVLLYAFLVHNWLQVFCYFINSVR
ncbi:uncharacterized protein LOC124165814 [Ischnura elegans]|uniref:uncharacterized protein LOC124165814 n=1 Tax=Ischnura elegans TaxID=197161 RepID=UPI001ED86F56|nr:uncharacterized protein LOC124165814 [Ischnura elegans]